MQSLLFLSLTLAPGQAAIEPPAPVPPAYMDKASQSADTRKAARDLVLRSVGPDALAFTKYFGDLGIYSLQKCSAPTGRRLVALFRAGALLRLKDPRSALDAVREHGDVAAIWLCTNIERLTDPEALEAWVKSPLEFIYDLRDVEQAAEELRAGRKFLPRAMKGNLGDSNTFYAVMGVLLALLAAAAYWKHGRKSAG